MQIKLSTSIRRFILLVLGVYIFLVVLVISISALSNSLNIPQVGNRLLQVGLALFVISWLILGSSADNAKDVFRSPQIRNDSLFKQRRKRQRPLEMALWAIIIATALVALTGFLSVYAVNLGLLLA
ncbi:MAG: hypothetical protein IPP66_04500 [Anaerolineales bacterium]|nr:hypothetical protein [Anaerolineales bacterium]